MRTAMILSSLSLAMAVPFMAKAGEGAGAGAPPPADEPAPAIETGTVGDIETGIAIPVRKGGKGGGASPYKAKIDALEVGQSFHVARKTKRSLNSTIHTFNKNYRIPELDANGAPVTEVKVGKSAKTGQETRKTVAKYTEARKFEHHEVDATDRRGPGVRIFRVK